MHGMEKKLAHLFTGIGTLFFIAVIALFTYRVYTLRERNVAHYEQAFSAFRDRLNASYRLGNGFDTPEFKNTAREFMEETSALNTFLVFSYDTGLLYFLPRNPEQLESWSLDFQGGTLPERRGVLVFDARIRTSLQVPGMKGVVMEGVFTVLPDEEVFPIIRDTFILVAAFFLLTCIMIAVLRLLSDRDTVPKPESPEESDTLNETPYAGGGRTGHDEYRIPSEPHDVRVSDPGFDRLSPGGIPKPASSETLHDPEFGPDVLFRENIPEFRPSDELEDFSIDTADLEPRSVTIDELDRLDEEPAPSAGRPAPSSGQPEPEQEPVHTPEPAEEPETEDEFGTEQAGRSSGTPAEAVSSGTDRVPAIRAVETSLARSGALEVVLGCAEVPSGEREDYATRRLSGILETSLPEDAEIIPYGGNSYLFLVTGAALDEMIGEAEKMNRLFHDDTGRFLRIGLSVRSGRTITAERFLTEVDQALAHARDLPGERIIGFRPDPKKFASLTRENRR